MVAVRSLLQQAMLINLRSPAQHEIARALQRHARVFDQAEQQTELCLLSHTFRLMSVSLPTHPIGNRIQIANLMIDRLTSDGCCTFPASAGHADKHAQPCSARDCTSSLAPTFNCRIASTASAGVRSRASATDIQSRDNACVCDVLYVCMYVCMYVCNVCTYVRTYVCLCVRKAGLLTACAKQFAYESLVSSRPLETFALGLQTQ